jgi:flagellar protein FliS
MTPMKHNDPTVEYRRTEVSSASSAELVVLLHDMLLQKLRLIQKVMNNAESRSVAVKDALDVLEVLQGTLNLEAGEVAWNMDRLYALLRCHLMEAHAKTSTEILEKQISILLPLRAAWMQAARFGAASPLRQNAPAPPPRSDSAPAAVPRRNSELEPTSHWSA